MIYDALTLIALIMIGTGVALIYGIPLSLIVTGSLLLVVIAIANKK
jgi:hypothetical protein